MSTALPPPTPMELPPEKGGCLRAGLIGCGIVALLCVLVLVGGVLYVRKNPATLLDFAMQGIERNFGPDVTEEDKKELRAAVEDVKEAMRNKTLRGDKDGGFQRSFRLGSGSNKLSHQDVQDLIKVFRDAAGKSGTPSQQPAAGPTMVPMVEPTRSP